MFFYESRGGKEVVGEARIIEVGSGTVDEVLARFGDDLFLTRPERGSQRVEELWENPEVVNKCMVLCKECFSRIDSIGCEEGIRKEGFVFVHRCPTRKIIFQNLLEKHGINYISGEREDFYERDELMYHLPD